jgi:hypothetical protein
MSDYLVRGIARQESAGRTDSTVTDLYDVCMRGGLASGCRESRTGTASKMRGGGGGKLTGCEHLTWYFYDPAGHRLTLA